MRVSVCAGVRVCVFLRACWYARFWVGVDGCVCACVLPPVCVCVCVCWGLHDCVGCVGVYRSASASLA